VLCWVVISAVSIALNRSGAISNQVGAARAAISLEKMFRTPSPSRPCWYEPLQLRDLVSTYVTVGLRLPVLQCAPGGRAGLYHDQEAKRHLQPVRLVPILRNTLHLV